MALQQGIKVWLKTGGPSMTVKYKIYNGNWLCTWFVGSEVKEHEFGEDQLTEKEPDEN